MLYEVITDAVVQIARSCVGIAALIGAPRINENERGKKLYNSAFFLSERNNFV